MDKEFVPYQPSLELKELGFDEHCFGRFYTNPKSKMFGVDEKGRHYPIKNTSKKLYTLGEYFVLNDDNVITAPTFSQCFRWFREKYKLEAIVQKADDFSWYKFTIYFYLPFSKRFVDSYHEFKTYEESELACLNKLIQIVKQKL
jgi:hypothetical protein